MTDCSLEDTQPVDRVRIHQIPRIRWEKKEELFSITMLIGGDRLGFILIPAQPQYFSNLTTIHVRKKASQWSCMPVSERQIELLGLSLRTSDLCDMGFGVVVCLYDDEEESVNKVAIFREGETRDSLELTYKTALSGYRWWVNPDGSSWMENGAFLFRIVA